MAEHPIDIKRTASAAWDGDLQQGKGTLRVGSGAFEGNYSFGTRMGNDPGTNPEELLGAASAGCFTMALSAALSKAGHPPKHLATSAVVHFTRDDSGFRIARIELHAEGSVPGVDEATFERIAHEAERGCPVSRALGGTPIELVAKLTEPSQV